MKSHTELATEFLCQHDERAPIDPRMHKILVSYFDVALSQAEEWNDDEEVRLPEHDEIHAAFPTRSGRHDLYARAMALVGPRRSKASLVQLVTWLLLKAERGSVTEPTGQGSMVHTSGFGWTPTGRTDGHGKFCESVDGKLVCTFCKEAIGGVR